MSDHIPDAGKMVNVPESVIDRVLFEQGYDHTESTSRAILSALSAAGWAVVPREPTEAMCSAGADELPTPTCENTDEEAAAEVYRAMLAAGEAHDDGR